MKQIFKNIIAGAFTLSLAYVYDWNAYELIFLYIAESVIFVIFYSQRIKALPKYESSFGVTTASISKTKAANDLMLGIGAFAFLASGFLVLMSYALKGYDIHQFWKVSPLLLLYSIDQYRDYKVSVASDRNHIRNLESMIEPVAYKFLTFFLIIFTGMFYKYQGFQPVAVFIVIVTASDVFINYLLNSERINSKLVQSIS